MTGADSRGERTRLPWLEIVIVNWNSLAHLQRCIAGLRASTRTGFELARIIIVDNGSRDGSVAWIDAQPDCVLLANDGNRGFAAACNQGAAPGRGDFILFLNPDVVVAPDTLSAAVTCLAGAAADVGIVGVRLVDSAGRTQCTNARFPTPWQVAGQCVGLDRVIPALCRPHFLDAASHAVTGEVDQVMGAFYLVRRSVYEALGGFDEQFFVYYEDLDFALRARRAGWKSLYLATASAVHAGGGTTARIPVRRLFYRVRSRLLYGRKHFSLPANALLLACTLLLEPVARIVHGLQHARLNGALQVLRAWGLLLRDLQRVLTLPLRTPALPTVARRRRRLRAVAPSTPATGTAAAEVLIFTMGKVGTTSLQKGLGAAGFIVHKAHCLDADRLRAKIAADRRQGRVLKTDLVARDLVLSVLPSRTRMPTVTLVRESIGRNMSGFFETLWRRGIHPPYDGVDVAALCRTFLDEFNHERPEQWFRQDFAPAVGVDPFASGFDPARGRGRIAGGSLDVLLLQLELGDDALGAQVGEFVGVNVPLRSRHRSRNKVYGELYAAFRRQIRFPAAFLDRMLSGAVMQAFYSAAQRDHVRRYYLREIPSLQPFPRA